MHYGGARAAIVVTIAAGLLGGCGGGGGESYGEVLRGLQRATQSNGGYEVEARTEDLPPVRRSTVRAFCEINREFVLNEEEFKVAQTGYYVVRIRERAERNLPYLSTVPVGRAVERLDDTLDLASFDEDDVRRYTDACYPPPES